MFVFGKSKPVMPEIRVVARILGIHLYPQVTL